MPDAALTSTTALDKRFANLPVDDDTTIIKQSPQQLGSYPACYQKWRWDGVRGESLILIAEDVAHLSEEELIHMLHATSLPKPGSTVTYKENDNGFTFLNFNFQA